MTVKIPEIKKIYTKKVLPSLKKDFGLNNDYIVPRIEKTIINIGIGKIQDGKERESIKKVIANITGQMPQDRPSKKSIAAFKTREGMLVGYRVTLRGTRMYEFLTKLVYAVLPRIRDFQGLKLSGVDKEGNLNIGIQEHIVFPELIGEDVNKIFSFQINIVASTASREQAIELYRRLGFPLEKEETEE